MRTSKGSEPIPITSSQMQTSFIPEGFAATQTTSRKQSVQLRSPCKPSHITPPQGGRGSGPPIELSLSPVIGTAFPRLPKPQTCLRSVRLCSRTLSPRPFSLLNSKAPDLHQVRPYSLVFSHLIHLTTSSTTDILSDVTDCCNLYSGQPLSKLPESLQGLVSLTHD